MRVTADNPSGWMQDLLLPWLEDPARDHRQLVRWLQALDLPPVDPDEEPYLWILRGLPTGGDLPEYEEKLAESSARLLDSEPDVRLMGGDPDMVCYNLLELCARLRCEIILAGPLRSLYRRNNLAGRRYLGMDLRHSLRFALTHNQPDCELEPVWMAMVRGEATPGLVGSRLDGYDGILHMQVRGQPGVPPREAIVRALSELSGVLKNSSERVHDFAALLLRLCDQFPGHFDSLALIQMSDKQCWPAWTDMAIPALFVRVGENHYVAWRPVYEFARQMGSVKEIRTFCAARVVELQVEAALAPLVAKVGEVVEEFRYHGEERNIVMCTAWSAVRANHWRNWPQTATRVAESLHANSFRRLFGPQLCTDTSLQDPAPSPRAIVSYQLLQAA
jgi:hypothetical protein